MTKKTTTTTREYDENGNLVKETIVETVEDGIYTYPNIPITGNPPKTDWWETTLYCQPNKDREW